MLSRKRLLQMAKKWHKAAALGRRRITSTKADAKCATTVAHIGHLFVYSADGKRFMIPLMYLSSTMFIELLRFSEEEFGLPSDGPITLPCDSTCMEYIISLLPFAVPEVVQRAVVTTVASSCPASLSFPRNEQQNLVRCGC